MPELMRRWSSLPLTTRHLLLILVVTGVTRLTLYVSYPLGGLDDNQSMQRYMVGELLDGNPNVGNLRYNSGYALAIAPIVALSQSAGALDERLVLLVQVGLASLVPFLLYDLLRRVDPTAALGVALVAALDLFGLQWAHLWLPVWLVALLLTVTIWCADRALRSERIGLPAWLWSLGAGAAAGVAGLGRLNVLPVIALLGVALLFRREVALRLRALTFVLLGAVSAGVVLLYLVLIHQPSTGTWQLSCLLGPNLIQSAIEKNVPMTAANGQATEEVLTWVALPPLRELAFTADFYPRWSEPGAWATEPEQRAFFAQTADSPPERLQVDYPAALIYYNGQCATDRMLRAVHHEAVTRAPLTWLVGWGRALGVMLVQAPVETFDRWHLPRYSALSFGESWQLGFQRASGANFYSDQWVWSPGVWLYSAIFNAVNLVKWLTPVAVVWALLSRRWQFVAPALLLLAAYGLAAAVDSVEPRTSYAIFYPLVALVLGGFIAAVLRRLRSRAHGSGGESC